LNQLSIFRNGKPYGAFATVNGDFDGFFRHGSKTPHLGLHWGGEKEVNKVDFLSPSRYQFYS